MTERVRLPRRRRTIIVVSLPATMADTASEGIRAMECLERTSSPSYCQSKQIRIRIRNIFGDNDTRTSSTYSRPYETLLTKTRWPSKQMSNGYRSRIKSSLIRTACSWSRSMCFCLRKSLYRARESARGRRCYSANVTLGEFFF